MVAEFTLLVLLLDFAVVHSGSLGFSARTLFFFFVFSSSLFSYRLSLLLRCLLLLLQDSSFLPLILYKDHRQTTSPPLSDCAELAGTLATSIRCAGFAGRRESSVRGAFRALRSSSPFPARQLLRRLPAADWNQAIGRLSRRQTSLLSSLLGSATGEGSEGGVSRVG